MKFLDFFNILVLYEMVKLGKMTREEAEEIYDEYKEYDDNLNKIVNKKIKKLLKENASFSVSTKFKNDFRLNKI